ncbi:calcium-translocating P-type ATPase, SERCA-type [Brevibacillus marinus]|uniref:calcium-translocating P-type ATPase, SERCA-type n=1 Tax=Brevibacillus marinus TaxID=2496837 RepID=UPI003B97A236
MRKERSKHAGTRTPSRHQQKWHLLSVEEAAGRLGADLTRGLQEAEVSKRQRKFGPNQLREAGRIPWFLLFLQQFNDFMVGILLVATVISFFLGEYLDAITIVAIIMLNGVLGFIQEARAERSLQALKELASPMARVVRNGVQELIPASQLVPGDLVLLEAGDRVPADLRIVSANRLEVEESALTGESLPVGKTAQAIGTKAGSADIPLGDRKNLAFMGTLVVSGTGRGIVTTTGMETEIGRIAHLINDAQTTQTPLQIRLEQMGKVLVVVALLLTVVVIVAGVWHGHDLLTMFLIGVSLAVAAIPEGLPAIVTVALALGVQRMVKRNAIVRKLPSVETLGCASVICSDKTGTLTQNKMTVTHLWHGDKRFAVSGSGYEPTGEIREQGGTVRLAGDGALRQLLRIAERCNNARLISDEQTERKLLVLSRPVQTWRVLGDPTEGALLVLAAKAQRSAGGVSLYPPGERVDELPFDAERKMMSVVERTADGKLTLLSKGAVEALLARSSHILWQGEVRRLSETLRQRVLQETEAMAKQALRVLGFAYKPLSAYSQGLSAARVENGLVFVGMAGMIDPPREEVAEAIAVCRRAGIKTVMITGDHKITAEAIARKIGLMSAREEVLEGRDLEQLSDEELAARVERVVVYARVSPEHKLRIVRALQQRGHVVAMTGDGVNDAPAIKSADIGVAMGQAGTDVTKEAADLVLRDDNFSTIVAAVEEGRNIYDNIRKFIRYLLASNVGEILVMFFAMLLGMPLPLVPIQILWVNLVTDGLPAMALGVDQAEKDTMEQKPRDKHEPIFGRGLGWKILSRGFLIGACTLGAFWLTWREHPADLVYAQTVAFATLVLAQLIHVFDCRSERSVFHRNPLENRYLVLAVLSSLLLVLFVIYVDFLQPIFKTTDLTLRDWSLVFVAAGIPTFVAGIGGVLRSGPAAAAAREKQLVP